MESIDKLRDSIVVYAADCDKGWMLSLTDEIEAEIAANYLELPVDVDGVPIHVGDSVVRAEELFRPNLGKKPAEVVCMLINSDGWSIGNCDPCGHWFHPASLEHVKPRTLEDVLTEMLDRNTDGVGYREFGGNFQSFVKSYADEIRELLGDDAE